MRNSGRAFLIAGAIWFALSCAIMMVLTEVEAQTGSTPELPRAGNIEWAGLLLYFGMYFGSWIVMLIGGAMILMAKFGR